MLVRRRREAYAFSVPEDSPGHFTGAGSPLPLLRVHAQSGLCRPPAAKPGRRLAKAGKLVFDSVRAVDARRIRAARNGTTVQSRVAMSTDDGIVWYLKRTEEDLGPVVVMTVEGRVSSTSALDLAHWLDAVDPQRHRAVVLDLSAVDYINGAGLRVLETAAHRLGSAGGELIVTGLQPVIRTTFDLSGPVPHLTIEPSAGAAVARRLGNAAPHTE